MSAADLARAIQIAVRGVDDLKLKTDFIEDLTRVVRLIVTGAVRPAQSHFDQVQEIFSTKAIPQAKVRPVMSSVTINGRPAKLPDDPDALLADVLRDDLALTGTKLVCGAGVCGACTVLLDGVPIVSCLTPAKTVAGRSITTVEGIGAADAASGAEGVHGARRPAVRLLHAGFYRRGCGLPRQLAQDERDGRAVARGDWRRAVRPSLPLRGV